MFKDEIKRKLNIKEAVLPFTLTLAGRDKVIINGVKTVLLSTPIRVRLRLGEGIAELRGDNLSIVEIGGDDVYVKGGVNEIVFE